MWDGIHATSTDGQVGDDLSWTGLGGWAVHDGRDDLLQGTHVVPYEGTGLDGVVGAARGNIRSTRCDATGPTGWDGMELRYELLIPRGIDR